MSLSHTRAALALLAGLACAHDSIAQPPDPPPPPLTAVPSLLVRGLIDRLGDDDAQVRQNVALALAEVGEPAVAALGERLTHKNPLVRASAAYALGQTGAGAVPALPGLLKCLTDKDVEVRRRASYAVARIVAEDRKRRSATPEIDPPTIPPPPGGGV